MKAFIVDLFHSRIKDRDAITGAGRLENGETFGFIDYRLANELLIRASDRQDALQALGAKAPPLTPSPRRTMDAEDLLALRAESLVQLRSFNKILLEADIRTYEGDLDYAMRYRIERGINLVVEIEGQALRSDFVDRLFIDPEIRPAEADIALRVLALDIETNPDATELFGFSFVSWTMGEEESAEEVHILGEAQDGDPHLLHAHKTETALLEAFRHRLIAIDPDIVTGWNVIDFDLSVLAKLAEKRGVAFSLGRTKAESKYRKSQYYGHSKLVMQGRQVLDAMTLTRHTLFQFEDLRLGTVAATLLGRGKTLVVEEWQDAGERIEEIFRTDRKAFTEYVLEDSRLVRDILKAQKLLELTLARSMLTSLSLERAWGSIAAFEALYISALHGRGMAAPSLGVDMETSGSGSGGLVLEPVVGLHEHVLVFDFKSLYPSLMRTFNIDPLAFVEGHDLASPGSFIEAPNGVRFSRNPGILPRILDEFTERREEAKRQKDALASYTYKIIMNSFYGVLATDACRFADLALADAITGFGQTLLGRMRDYFEDLGLEVLYGDTDSLFVRVASLDGQPIEAALAEGHRLTEEANRHLGDRLAREYGVVSRLELEFETYFRFAFFPPVRQGEGGRAKNYAGLSQTQEGEELDITGLEAVRSDWTPLARQLQRELLDQLFHSASPETMVQHIRATIKRMRRGEVDKDLIYRKRIRRPLESYTKTTPPHIRAARLLPKPVRVVRYLLTKSGPQPLGFVSSDIDYDHYLKKQIRPIVETLAPFSGFDAEEALESDSGLNFHGDFL